MPLYPWGGNLSSFQKQGHPQTDSCSQGTPPSPAPRICPLLNRERLQLAPGLPLPILELRGGEAALHPVPIQGLEGLGTNFGS
jgi:hypothetical protein